MRTPSPRYGMPRPAPRKSRLVWLWLAALVPLGLIASVGFLFALGLLFNMTGEEIEPSLQERGLVLDIGALSVWLEDQEPRADRGRLTKTRYIDRSYELEYVFDDPEDDAAPYLSYSLTFEPSESDAKTTYLSYWGGTQVGLYVFTEVEIGIDERNEIFAWGDESRFGVLTADDAPFGNVFVARRENMVVYLMLTGIYFEDPEAFSQLLTPRLEKLTAYAPEL